MDQLGLILTAVVGVFSVVAIGAVLRRVGWLTQEADGSLMRVIVRVLIPCLFFGGIAGNSKFDTIREVSLPPVVGFLAVAVGLTVAWLAVKAVGHRIGLRTGPQRRTFVLCVGMFNYGYVPIPLVAAIFGEADPAMGTLYLHNVGVEIAMWTLGLVVLAGGFSLKGLRGIVNPPTIAIAAALLLNFTGLSAFLPSFVLGAAGMLGRSAIPLALLLIGGSIVDEWAALHPRRAGPTVAAACWLRLGMLPVLFLASAAVLRPGEPLERVMAIEAAMPAAVFPIVLARMYGGDVPTAVRVGLGTAVVSLITMPLWITAGLRLLGVGP